MEIPLTGGINPMKTRRKKFGVGSLIVLLIIGLVFIGIGIAIAKASKIDPSWTRIAGKVTGSTLEHNNNGGPTYAPIVSYTVNGQTYTVTSSTSSSSLPATGSTKQVAYNPTSPAEAKVVDSTGSIFGYGAAVIGVIMIIIGPVAFIKSLKRTKDIKDLTQSGQKIQGILTSVQNNASAGMNNQNNQNSYRVIVSATGPNGVQNYTSDWITGLGELALFDYRSHPIPVDVYVNPTNPQDYYVDIADLPGLTTEGIMNLVRSATGHANPSDVSQTPSFSPPATAAPAPTAPPTDQNPPTTPPQA